MSGQLASAWWRRRRLVALVTAAVLSGFALQLLGANPAATQSLELTAAAITESPGLDPDADLWANTASIDVPLTAQATTAPFGGGSIETLEARAVHDGESLFLRLEWTDDAEDLAAAADEFTDAVAVQFPGVGQGSVPAICMGQAESNVNIWQWRADLQAGRPRAAEDLGAVVDVEAADEPLSFPAEASGNPLSDPDAEPVQNLLAAGFGTLAPAPDDIIVDGHAVRGEEGWSAVFMRPLVVEADGQPDFFVGGHMDVAFAVWDGSNHDRDGQKSVSQFVTLGLSEEGLDGGTQWGWIALGIVVVAVLVGAVTVVGVRRR